MSVRRAMGRANNIVLEAAAAAKRKKAALEEEQDDAPPPRKKKKVVAIAREEDAEVASAPPKKTKKSRPAEPEPTVEASAKTGAAAKPATEGKMKASEARKLQKALKREGAAAEGAVAEEREEPVGKQGTVFVSFVGGMPPSFDREAFKALFVDCGKIVDLAIPMRDSRKGREPAPRGIAFITFASHRGVKRALLKDSTEFDGREIKVKSHTSKSAAEKKAEATAKAKAKARKNNAEFTVFVSNLADKAQQADVKAHFRKCGNIAGCRILTTKGIAFFNFKRQQGFEKALELNGQDFEGKTLYVAKAASGSDADNLDNDGGAYDKEEE